MPPTLIVDDRRRLVKGFVSRVGTAAAAAVATRGRFTMAVTGGRDAQVLLPALAGARVDWTRTHLFWGDERAVPATDADSNYGQIKSIWLDRAPRPPAHVYPMQGDATDLDEAAGAYAATLASVLGPTPALDVFVLGMGPDGHVCSIFPGHPLMVERARTVVALRDAPKPPARRLTMTLPVIARARLVLVMALSADKRAALDNPGSDLPIAHVLREAAQVAALVELPSTG